ncbi:MAG: ATP-binding protein [Nocardioides sp.]
MLRLDDFYKSGSDPSLPRITDGANAGLVDWDDPQSWLIEEACDAIETLCREGVVDVPVYELAANGRTGWHRLDLAGSPYFVAEGIFAQDVVPRLQAAGLLADALCVTQRPIVTFWRRLTRDLREHRKPPAVLVRRGLVLMREQRAVVAHAVELGCRPVSNHDALDAVRGLAEHAAR